MTTAIAIGSLVAGLAAYLTYRQIDDSDGRSNPGTTAGTTESTAGSHDPPVDSTTGSPVRADGPLLGRDARQLSSESCRAPTAASGSSWQSGPVTTGGVTYELGYSCSLFARGTGTMDFDLGGRYRELRLTLGFHADSPGVHHRVRFEIIGDGRFQLADRTLRFGETADLKLDVSAISRIRLQVTEVGAAEVDPAPSRPVWANPTLR